jgi:predicted ATP-grasp superfamily ATP-dependent carboligase
MSEKPSVLLGFPREVSGLSVIRSLTRQGVRIAAYDCDPGSAGLHAREVRKRHIYANPDDDPEAFVSALIESAPEGERPVLIDLEGHALDVIARNYVEIAAHYQLLVPDYAMLDIAQDKAATALFFEDNDLGAPATLLPESEIDVQNWTGGYPAVFKPRRGKGGRGQYKVANVEEAVVKWADLEAKSGEYMMQAWIEGPVENLFTVGLLADKDSRLLALFSGQRLEVVQTPNIPEGPTAFVRSQRIPDLLKIAEEFVRKIGWRGLAELEFKLDARDGKFKILEINPRIWAWVELPVSCGVDFPYLYYQAAQGISPAPSLSFDDDVYYLRVILHSYTQIHRLLSGKQNIFSFVRRIFEPYLIFFQKNKKLVLEDIRLRREYWYWFRFYLRDTDLL